MEPIQFLKSEDKFKLRVEAEGAEIKIILVNCLTRQGTTMFALNAENALKFAAEIVRLASTIPVTDSAKTEA